MGRSRGRNSIMTKQERKIIKRICKEVRKKLLKEYNQYLKYSIDAGVFAKNSLAGWCDQSSIALQKALLKHNIDTKMIQGEVKNGGLHYWLEYKHNIIDLTACQFNRYKLPLILIRPISKLKYFIGESMV